MKRGIPQSALAERTRNIRRQKTRPAPRTQLIVERLEARELLSAAPVRLGPLVQVTSSSPFAGNNADNLGSQPGFAFLNSEVEPSLAADPSNPKHLVGVWQQDRFSDHGARGMVAAVTFDGGDTWTTAPVPGLTLVAGGAFQRTSDPWVSISPSGDVYVSALILNGTDATSGVRVLKSTDGGLTWGAPVNLITENDPNVVNDKETVTADWTDPNRAYVVWDRLVFNPDGTVHSVALLSQTYDRGNTWSAPQPIFDGGPNTVCLGNQIVVLPNGTLVDACDLIDFNTFDLTLEVVRSTDRGATWSAPIVVSPMLDFGVFDFFHGQFLRTGDELPSIAVDHNNGNLYTVWTDGRFNDFFLAQVAFSASKDGGLTWSTPVQVNQTPNNIFFFLQQAFTPEVAVAANGTVAVTYYDLRNPDGQGFFNLPTDAWMVFCKGGADPTNPANWGNEQRLTNASFSIEFAPNNGGPFLGDYVGLVAGGHDANSFATLFTQAISFADPTSLFYREAKPTGALGTSASSSGLAAASPFTSTASTSGTSTHVSRSDMLALALQCLNTDAAHTYLDNDTLALDRALLNEAATADGLLDPDLIFAGDDLAAAG